MKMTRVQPLALGIVAALAVPCFAATMPKAHSQNSAWQQGSGQQMDLMSANAKLIEGVNSKDARQGQVVMAKLTTNVKNNGSTQLRKGTVLTGTVTRVERSASNGKAMVSIEFNRARLKNGQTVPVKVTLLGVYPPASPSYMGGADAYMGDESHAVPNDQKITQTPGLLRHITMQSEVQSDVSGVFTSEGHNVDLRRGTRMRIAIARQMGSGNAQSGM